MSEEVIVPKPETVEQNEHFDVGIFCDENSSDDERAARDLEQIIEQFRTIHETKIAIVTQNWFSGNRCDSMQDALNRCTIMFVIISESLLKSPFEKALTSHALTFSIQNGDGKKFIPIFHSRKERDKLLKVSLPAWVTTVQGHNMEKLRDPESFSCKGFVREINRVQPMRIRRQERESERFQVHSQIYNTHKEYQRELERAEGEQALRDLRIHYGQLMNNLAIDAGYNSFRSLSMDYSISIPELSSITISTIPSGETEVGQRRAEQRERPRMTTAKNPVENEYPLRGGSRSSRQPQENVDLSMTPHGGLPSADTNLKSQTYDDPQPLTVTSIHPPAQQAHQPQAQSPPDNGSVSARFLEQPQELSTPPRNACLNQDPRSQAAVSRAPTEPVERIIPTVVEDIDVTLLISEQSSEPSSSPASRPYTAGSPNLYPVTDSAVSSYTEDEVATRCVRGVPSTLDEDGRLPSYRLGGVQLMDSIQNWSIAHRQPDTDSVRAEHDDASSVGDLTSQCEMGDEVAEASCLGEDFDSGDEQISPDTDQELPDRSEGSTDRNMVDLDSMMLARATGDVPLSSLNVPHCHNDMPDVDGESVSNFSMCVEAASTVDGEINALDDSTMDQQGSIDQRPASTGIHAMDESVAVEAMTAAPPKTPTRSAHGGIMHRSLLASDLEEMMESTQDNAQWRTVEPASIPTHDINLRQPPRPDPVEPLQTGGLNTLSQPLTWPQVAWGRNRRGSESGRRPIRTNLTKQFLSLASIQSLSSRLLRLHHHPSLNNVSEFDDPPRFPEGVRLRMPGFPFTT